MLKVRNQCQSLQDLKSKGKGVNDAMQCNE